MLTLRSVRPPPNAAHRALWARGPLRSLNRRPLSADDQTVVTKEELDP